MILIDKGFDLCHHFAMDNISHTLISVGLGAAFAGRMPAAGRRTAIWTAVLAGNIPDIDILTSMVARQNKLIYLLHHRGHTHTILYALLTGLIVGSVAGWIGQKKISNPADRKFIRSNLILVGLLSVLLHLFMDWWNLYGIHPFYPFNNNWYYGDAVFIVEPMIWLALVPFCWRISLKKRYKFLTGLVPIFALGLAVSFHLYDLLAAMAVLLIVAYVWDRKKPEQHSGFLLSTLIISAFFVGSIGASSYLKSEPAVPPGARFIDAALAPSPGNPFCWKFYVVSLDNEDYVVRTGTFSHLPAFVDPRSCYLDRGAEKTAALKPIKSDLSIFSGIGEYRTASVELKKLMTNCEFSALAGFARMPFFSAAKVGNVFGDLRFDVEPGLGFSEFILNPAANCASLGVPPWTPPRQDFLGGEAR